jgi:Tol biopolymer transport system component
VNSDGSGARRVAGGFLSHPSWSPDGSSIVVQVVSQSIHQPSYLSIIDVASGREVEQLPTGGSPRWLPEDEILFFNAGKLWAIRPDGSGLRRLTHSGSVSVDWTGSEMGPIVYSRDITAGKAQVFEVGLDGKNLRRITNREASAPAFSPDNRMLAFVGPDGGGFYVFTMPVAGGTPRRLVRTVHRGSVSWSPNGRRLAFPTRRSLATVGADGKNFRRIRGTTRSDSSPDWSPDGRFLAFTRVRGVTAMIMRISVEGGIARIIRRNAYAPDWSPTGRRLVYVRLGPTEVSTHLWTVRPDGRRTRRLTRGILDDAYPRWSPDGRWIAFRRSGSTRGPDEIRVVRSSGGASRRVANVFAGGELAWRR